MVDSGQIVIKIALVLIEKNGSFLLIKRKKPLLGLLWAFPGGVQNPGETEEQSAIREAKEETGLDVEIVGTKLFEWKHPRTYVQTVYFHCKQLDPNQEAIIGEEYEIAEMEWVPASEVFERFTTESSPLIREFVLSFARNPENDNPKIQRER